MASEVFCTYASYDDDNQSFSSSSSWGEPPTTKPKEKIGILNYEGKRHTNWVSALDKALIELDNAVILHEGIRLEDEDEG